MLHMTSTQFIGNFIFGNDVFCSRTRFSRRLLTYGIVSESEISYSGDEYMNVIFFFFQILKF